MTKQFAHRVESSQSGIAALDERYAARIVELNRLGLGDWAKLSIYSAKGVTGHFTQLLKDSPGNGYYYFGYFQDGCLAGYIEWRILEGGQWFLNNMDVAEQAQGAGIERKLVDHGLAFGMTLGINSVALDVYRSNGKVLSWYETFGLRSKGVSYIYEFSPRIPHTQEIYSIGNLAEAVALYTKRGYAMLELSGKERHTVGLPNAHYFVVRKLDEVANDALIGAVLQAFPGRRGLLFSDSELSSPKLLLNEVSVRMEMVL